MIRCPIVHILLHGNRNRKLQICRASTKAKSREPAYSQALSHNKIDRQWSCPESQAGRQSDGSMVDGVWTLELRRGGRYGEDDESGYDLLKSRVFVAVVTD